MFIPGNTMRHEVGFVLPERVQREQGLLNASAVLVFRAKNNSGWEVGKNVLRNPLDIALNTCQHTARGQPCFADPAIKVVVDLEQLSDPDSRVRLSSERDAFGVFKATTDWRIAELEPHTTWILTEMVGAKVVRLGLGETRLAPWLLESRPLSDQALVRIYHDSGTTRLSGDPRHDGVNADCRMHGLNAIFVAGRCFQPEATPTPS